MTKMKKTIAILLAVLFLVTVTAGAVSAGPIKEKLKESGKIEIKSLSVPHHSSSDDANTITIVSREIKERMMSREIKERMME